MIFNFLNILPSQTSTLASATAFAAPGVKSVKLIKIQLISGFLLKKLENLKFTENRENHGISGQFRPGLKMTANP